MQVHRGRINNFVETYDFRFRRSKSDKLLALLHPRSRKKKGCRSSPFNRSSSSAGVAHLGLQVVLQAHLADQIDLGFQEIDVLFGVIQDLLQQVARDIVTH